MALMEQDVLQERPHVVIVLNDENACHIDKRCRYLPLQKITERNTEFAGKGIGD